MLCFLNKFIFFTKKIILKIFRGLQDTDFVIFIKIFNLHYFNFKDLSYKFFKNTQHSVLQSMYT